MANRIQNRLLLWSYSWKLFIGLILFMIPLRSLAQCFSAANPVGGTANLLVLDKKTLRYFGFYRHAYSNKYFEGSSRSDFDQVKNAAYHYLGTILAYGLTQKFTLETEWGYYLNKHYNYNLDPVYNLKGTGFTNTVINGKFRLYTNYQKRLFLSGSVGLKVPLTLNPREVDGVVLPVDLQPSTNAFGTVFQGFFVKEKSETGWRYFLVSRLETNFPNKNDYQLGTALFSSLFVSKHIPDHWIKGDWTAILQVRNEFRTTNRREHMTEKSTGGCLFLLSPQINHYIKEKWNVSLIFDIPVYQYYKGTQLSYTYAFTFNLARDFTLY